MDELLINNVYKRYLIFRLSSYLRVGVVVPDQLSRLHMILKPFMLRRIKKDVENELSDKVDVEMIEPFCAQECNILLCVTHTHTHV